MRHRRILPLGLLWFSASSLSGGSLLCQTSLPATPTDTLSLRTRDVLELPKLHLDSTLKLGAPIRPQSPSYQLRPQLPEITRPTLQGDLTSLPKVQLAPPSTDHKIFSIGRLRLESFPEQIDELSYANTRLYAKQINLSTQLNPLIRLNASAMLGHTHSPYQPVPEQMYQLYTGLSISPSQDLRLNLGVAFREQMRYQYWNPHLSVQANMSDRLRLQLYSGLSQYTTANPIGQYSLHGIQYYLGGRLDYALGKNVYLYGNAHTSIHQGIMGSTIHPYLNQWSPSLGGGIGFNIEGCGPIEIGVQYHYNPISRRMEPMPWVNIVGAVNLVIKAIASLFD
ncbi:MAG: hypothetical protein Q4A64_03080 [Porphyromonadaceae bacterium]|nr:hypothetical protein [Porphyromonadaceae bacterium]